MKQGDQKLSKKKLIELRGNRCEECGLGPRWKRKPLTLQVHDHRTNAPRVLCPNCHTQTDNYGGRCGKGKKRPAHSILMTGDNNPMKRAEQRFRASKIMSEGRKSGKINPNKTRKQRAAIGAKSKARWENPDYMARQKVLRSGQNNSMSKTNREKRAKT